MAGQTEMHIGEVAAAVGLPLRTVRLFDEAGVVRPSKRTSEGSGLYSDADLDRLRLAKRLKPLDLTLEEAAEVIDALHELAQEGTAPDRRRELVERLSRTAAVGEEQAAHLRHELDAAESITGELRRAVLRAGKQPSPH